MDKEIILILVLVAMFIPDGHFAPAPDPGLSESVYGAPAKKVNENRIEKAPVAAAQQAAAPPSFNQHQLEQLERQKEQLKQLRVKQLEQQEVQKQKALIKSTKSNQNQGYVPQVPAKQPQQPAVASIPHAKSSYPPTPTMSNHLDDYPPKDRLETGSNYLNTPNTAQFYQPIHQGLYRGYPYMYGYPLEMRYGHPYGHAFTTDDNFQCPGDGRYYRDFGSFYSCEGGTHTVQFCAPGSRNSLPTYNNIPLNEVQPFCNVNIVGSHYPMLIPH